MVPNEGQPLRPPALGDLRPFSAADWNEIGFGTGIQIFGDPQQQLLIELTRLAVVPGPHLLVGLALTVLVARRLSVSAAS